jgi:rubrerythrin
MPVQNVMTADFLRSAYGGESMAHMRYLSWGNIAEKEGFANIGKLFKGIAYAEQVHADNHFRELRDLKSDHTVAAGAAFGIGTLAENLQMALNGELHEIEQMYPVYLKAAEFQNEKGAQRTFNYALEAEKVHASLFENAITFAKEGKDMSFNTVNVCPICGHTVIDDVPDKCPICGAKKEIYKVF